MIITCFFFTPSNIKWISYIHHYDLITLCLCGKMVRPTKKKTTLWNGKKLRRDVFCGHNQSGEINQIETIGKIISITRNEMAGIQRVFFLMQRIRVVCR